jgi:sulfur carrier protein ThiS adenylyltransferase
MNIFEQNIRQYYSDIDIGKIENARIGIGGAGGLGSNCAMMLVRSGFKYLEFLDHDKIEASNLNRQQYFFQDIGKPKALITKERLLAINPDAQILAHEAKWSPDNAKNFFQNCTIIVEAFDNADFKHQFVEYYQDKARYIVSGNGMAGLNEKLPMTRRRIGNVYFNGNGTTDSVEGHPPLAPRVTQCAAMMAQTVLDLTLGVEPVCG